MARYFKLCPRGFANEVTYFRVKSPEQEAEIEAWFDGYEAKETAAGNPTASCGWTNDARAQMVAIPWERRPAMYRPWAEVQAMIARGEPI